MSVVTVNQTVNDVQVVVGRVTHVLVGRQGPIGPKGETGEPGAGFEPRGPWSALTEYVARDLVEHDGSAYYTLSDVQGTEPPDSPWVLLVEKGEKGDTGDVGPQGPQGIQGATGSAITSGTGTPSSDGVTVGDLYVDASTGDLYEWS